MFATIVQGKADLADVLFLIGVVLLVAAAVAASPRGTVVNASAAEMLGWLGLGFVACGLLVL